MSKAARAAVEQPPRCITPGQGLQAPLRFECLIRQGAPGTECNKDATIYLYFGMYICTNLHCWVTICLSAASHGLAFIDVSPSPCGAERAFGHGAHRAAFEIAVLSGSTPCARQGALCGVVALEGDPGLVFPQRCVIGLAVSSRATAGRFDLGNLPFGRRMSLDIKLCCAVYRP